jgi:hypothetical protein
MGVVITGLAFGITIATAFAPNLIGETGAVLPPAVSGALRDATGAWEAAILLDAGLIAVAVALLCFVREEGVPGRAPRRERSRGRSPALTGRT